MRTFVYSDEGKHATLIPAAATGERAQEVALRRAENHN